MFLVPGSALQDMIRNCGLHPSGVAKWQVEDVFKATLGRSRQWLWKCRPDEYVIEDHGEPLQTHAILVRTLQPMIISNEMTLYPYMYNFYGLGKVLCLPKWRLCCLHVLFLLHMYRPGSGMVSPGYTCLAYLASLFYVHE